MYQDVTNEGLATLSVPNKRVSGITAPTMYRVKVMFADEDNNLFPKPLECREEILLPIQPEGLKSKLCEWWDDYLDGEAPYPMCFIVQEIPLFSAIRPDAHIREWIYKGNCLLSESLCCHNYGTEKFMGRPAELIRFKEGDLVNIVYDDKLSAGLVLATPPTDTEVMQRFDEFRKELSPSSSDTADWEAYDTFDSDPATDCYRILVAHDDHSLTIESGPSSRVIRIHLNHHLPHELACLLTYKLREVKNESAKDK